MKKLNWGHKLVFFTAIFMVFIITMVYQISAQKIDLVDQNYYERGVMYQQDINKYEASGEVPHEVSYQTAQQTLRFKVSGVERFGGTLILYRVDDAALDLEVPFQLSEQGDFTYTTTGLKKGPWKATFEWTFNGKLMASEKQFVVE
ncbi:MAG: hypothetical protein EAY81_10770 [Bacteroidetes bacterium]|nr:MAG: hypothetical protein EAY81_10770 [Bacteroidota bacterium]